LNYDIFSWISLICKKTIKHPLFELFTIIIIILNSIILALADPLAKEQTETENFFEIFFLTVYTIEMILKIGAEGFLFSRNAYLKFYWNILDFVIVVSGKFYHCSYLFYRIYSVVTWQ